jgi:general secretion pathway protein I
MRRSLRSARGFSLLEVVVALAIMALALGTLYRALGGSARAAGDSTQYERAAILAESVLQSHDSVPAAGWNEEGAWDIFRWSVASTPYLAAADARAAIHRVQVVVAWSDGLRERNFSLVSLRPVRAEPVGVAPQ